MLDIEAITNAARDFADDARNRHARLEGEMRGLQERLAEVEAQLHAADLAQQRFARFDVTLDGDLLCPRCWIDNEVRAALTPMPSKTADDITRCRKCGFEITIPA